MDTHGTTSCSGCGAKPSALPLRPCWQILSPRCAVLRSTSFFARRLPLRNKILAYFHDLEACTETGLAAKPKSPHAPNPTANGRTHGADRPTSQPVEDVSTVPSTRVGLGPFDLCEP